MKKKNMTMFKTLTSIIILPVFLPTLTLTNVFAVDTFDDYLSANGRALVDAAGNPVRFAGITWFGLETKNQVYHGLWSVKMEDVFDTMADQGFNLLRVLLFFQLVTQLRNGHGGAPSSVNYSVNRWLEGMKGLQIMDASIAYCKQIGLKVMLDIHRVVNTQMLNTWYTDDYPPGDFEACWLWLAQRYANDGMVAITGIDHSTTVPCDSPAAASLQLTIDGAGDFYRVTSKDIDDNSSWNMQLVEINGVDYTNIWSGQSHTCRRRLYHPFRRQLHLVAS